MPEITALIECKSCSNKTHRSLEFCVLTFVILTLIISGPVIHAAEQYKKLGRDAVPDIVDGRYDAAVEHCEGR
jgi:hypothetical protein